MRTRTKPRKVYPESWPKWPFKCEHIHWRRGDQCKNLAVRGCRTCRRHGAGGIVEQRGYERYLLWCLLPESMRVTYANSVSVVTDDMFDQMALALAKFALTGDERMSGRARLFAAVAIMQYATALETHPDPALLLTHLSRSDADTAIEILRRNGLMQ